MAAASSCYFSLCLLFLVSGLAVAKDFLVGGSVDSWTTSPQLLNRWAEANRFQVGDSLVWKKEGSVLEVTRESYLACNKSSPVAEHSDGKAAVKLVKSGPHYFISGEEGACEKGVKLVVVVMAERWRRAATLSPAPSPAVAEAPVPMVAGAPFSASPCGGIVAAGLFMTALWMGL